MPVKENYPLLKHITCPIRSLTLTAPLIHSILSFRHRIPLFPRVNYPLDKCNNHSIPFSFPRLLTLSYCDSGIKAGS